MRAFSRAQLYLLSPALVFTSLARAETQTSLILEVLVFILCMQSVILAMSLAVGFAARRDRAGRQAIAISSVFVNSGFYGIPVCMLAFGQWGLVYGTIYMVASSITQSTIGIFLASAGRQSSREAAASIFKVPLVYSIVAARLLVRFHALPGEPYMKMLNLLAQAAIPLGLLLLGMQLERIVLEWLHGRAAEALLLGTLANIDSKPAEAEDTERSSAIEGTSALCQMEETASTLWRDLRDGIAAAAFRIIGGFVVSFALVQVFDFGASMNQVLVLQSSMPTAVNMVVYATEWDCKPRIVSAAILASTLASAVSLPFVLKVLGA